MPNSIFTSLVSSIIIIIITIIIIFTCPWIEIRALLRHGISLWIDVPLDLVARDVTEDHSQFTPSEISFSGSSPEVYSLLWKVVLH